MTLPLSPELLRGAYEYLRTTPPFRRWKLPPAEEVEFVITRNDHERGHYDKGKTSEHRIGVSQRCIGHTSSLMEVMAHELVHLRQAMTKTATPNTKHNAEFWRLARSVCRAHGFDPKLFIALIALLGVQLAC